MNNKKPIIYKELSHDIIGAAMQVHNELGPGWAEEAYHLAMVMALEARGIKVESKLNGKLYHRNLLADEFQLDILVADKIILELKHLKTGFAQKHYVQLINYLKFWKKNLGILINFGLERLRYKRIPYTPVPFAFESTGAWDGYSTHDPEMADTVKSVTVETFREHGLGYGLSTCEALFETACRAENLECERPETSLRFKGIEIRNEVIPGYLMDSTLLSLFSAERDQTSAAMLARLLTYLRHLCISSGLLINFGKESITLRAVISK